MNKAMENCPFKSPDELGLTLKERDALIKALLLMEAGKMEHVHRGSESVKDGHYPFNMGVWRDHYDCGTICCIGGTAELVGGLGNRSLSVKSHSLHTQGKPDLYRLFYQYKDSRTATPARAAAALRGYLTTGKTRW